MEMSGIRLGRRSVHELERLLAAADAATFTYDHQGSTTRPGAPGGVPNRRFERVVEGSVALAAEALDRWSPHDGIRATILPAGVTPTAGSSVVVVARVGPFEMAVPNRVVLNIDELDRVGFVYGTLPGHAEAGEELFLAETAGAEEVRLIVRIHARPATLIARLGTPVVVLLQRVAARRYLAAWAAAIQEANR